MFVKMRQRHNLSAYRAASAGRQEHKNKEDEPGKKKKVGKDVKAEPAEDALIYRTSTLEKKGQHKLYNFDVTQCEAEEEGEKVKTKEADVAISMKLEKMEAGDVVYSSHISKASNNNTKFLTTVRGRVSETPRKQ